MKRTHMTRISAVAAAGLLAASLAACSDNDDTTATTTAPAPAETTEQATPDATDEATTEASDDETSSSGDASVTESDALPEAGAKAMDTVLAAHPGDVIELDWDNQRSRWKVEVLSEDKAQKVEVYTNAEGTEVTETDDVEKPDPKDLDRVAAIQVSITEAINQVMKEHPGIFDEAELTDDNGRIVWSVEVDKEGANQEDIEMYVDVKTAEMYPDD